MLGFGIYLLINFRIAALTPSLTKFNIASMVVVIGIVITCVSFLGFMGALKENRCLLLTVPRLSLLTQHIHRQPADSHV